MTNVIHVVGDGFISFSQHANVITLSEFEEMIGLPRIGKAKNGSYILGQGISVDRIQKIKQRIQENKINDIFIKDNFCKKEDNRYVHKKLSENVMITEPIVIRDALYASHLLIDDRCAEMSDHLTGQHVQGMVLIEAARQMSLSVMEHFFLSDDERFNSYFVLNNIDVQFKQFIFPLEAELRCAVLDYEKQGIGKFSATCAVDFFQNNISCTRIAIQLLADGKIKLEKKEAKLADFNLQVACSKLGNLTYPTYIVREKC